MLNKVLPLSENEQQLVNKLIEDGEARIADLFLIRRPCRASGVVVENHRRQQQILGAAISRINQKWRAQGLRQKIAPGQARGTYAIKQLV